MSTRSGKRIHKQFSVDIDNTLDSEVVPRNEKKTRNKRLKENELREIEDRQELTIPKSKMQKHYVGYPTDDEVGYTTASEAGIRSTRKSKKNTLKEHDINVIETENIDENNGDKKNARVTRRTKRFTENVEDVTQNADTEVSDTLPNKKVKGKKNKKKNSKNHDINENIPEPVRVEEPEVVSKKSKKKNKKGKQATSSTEEVKQVLNRSNISTDSFHSAAGSPMHVTEYMEVDNMNGTLTPGTFDRTLVNENEEPEIKMDSKMRRKSSVKPATPEQANDEPELNETLKKDSKNKRKSSLKNTTIRKQEIDSTFNDLNSTYDKIEVETEDKPNTSVVKEPKARRSLLLNNSIIENQNKLNTTFEKETKSRMSLPSNHVENGNGGTNVLNATFEKETESRKSLPTNHVENSNDVTNVLNATFEKSSNTSQNRVISLDSTFDKNGPKLNTTFDKTETKSNSGRSSLISSDEGTVNVTFDKDNSKISITSDDSKTENIVNTTPLLIESSMDESQLSTSKTPEKLNVTKDIISPTPNGTLQPPITPLKREGTFTKESPDIKTKTPTKRLTMPSPGLTLFHLTRNSYKEKSMLNVTQSLEKSRRSSLADLAPLKQTRVMFCSPVNNPALVMQQKKKVIKSSMKGSNKSFVFDENVSSVVKSASRKRSYTQSDADDTRVKRTRLADDIQHSVDRLSRPRTSSAAAKLPDTTPSKKAPTPCKPKSDPKRTKLPNFAALHQKQFDKMESLDECQRRKLRRAKKLMIPKTPNGTVVVLERSSPRGTAEQTKQKEATKKPESPVKKPVTPVKKPVTPVKKPVTPAKKLETAAIKSDTSNKPELPLKLPKLPTLESLRPGFTRFGFKMNTDFNPFSIPSKTDRKPITNSEKPNGLTAKPSLAAKTPTVKSSRLPTLPSKAGATTTRKEAAKQVVMREKSFTTLSGKREVKRYENMTIIKGVRTNRRFELQMKMRNID